MSGGSGSARPIQILYKFRFRYGCRCAVASAHHVRAAGAIVACVLARGAGPVQIVQGAGGDGERAAGDAAAGLARARRGALIGQGDGAGMFPAVLLVAALAFQPGFAAGKGAQLADPDFDARRAVDVAAQVAP